MDLDLNPADFLICDGFGFDKFCLTGFGFFFSTAGSVPEL